MFVLVLVTILSTSAQGQNAELTKQSLSGYSKAICNDGSPAAYYLATEGSTSGDVLIYLEGGGSCTDPYDCQLRCDRESYLCSSTEYPNTLQGEAVVFSLSQEENPAFASFEKVYVPYCSSDEHSGNKEASEETGNFHFNGRNIVSAIVEDLHANGIFGQKTKGKVVLAGASAGGAGAARNCDFVADKVKSLGYDSLVSCVLDGADLEPFWMTNECDLIEEEAYYREFWNAQEDKTCLQILGNDAVECSAFSMFWPYIESPFMVVSSEADPVVHFCADDPSLGDNSEGSFGRQWREGMVQLGLEMVASNRTDIGVFLGNCPFHVAMEMYEIYGMMPVTVVEEQGTRITLKEALVNWISGQGSYHAIDRPDEINPSCPASRK